MTSDSWFLFHSSKSTMYHSHSYLFPLLLCKKVRRMRTTSTWNVRKDNTLATKPKWPTHVPSNTLIHSRLQSLLLSLLLQCAINSFPLSHTLSCFFRLIIWMMVFFSHEFLLPSPRHCSSRPREPLGSTRASREGPETNSADCLMQKSLFHYRSCVIILQIPTHSRNICLNRLLICPSRELHVIIFIAQVRHVYFHTNSQCCGSHSLLISTNRSGIEGPLFS